MAAAFVVLALVLAFSVEASWAAQPSPARSLAGETFDTNQVSYTCTPSPLFGTHTISFTATGQALGPYPGTFTETGQLTGTVVFTPTQYLFTITGFSSTFSINSPQGQVTGSKQSTQSQQTGWVICTAQERSVLDYQHPMSYRATISTTGGTYVDEGAGFVSAVFNYGTGSFFENFQASNFGEFACSKFKDKPGDDKDKCKN